MEFPATSDLVKNTFCVMETSAGSKRVFSMAEHVVNSRRTLRSKRSILTKRFHIFTSQCFLKLPLALK